MSNVSPDKTNSMMWANGLGALQSLKLSTLKRHYTFCMTRAVLSWSPSSISIYQ